MVLISDLLATPCLTRKLFKPFVIRVASCMQIDQPTMKKESRAPKPTPELAASSHCQAREALGLSHRGAWDLDTALCLLEGPHRPARAASPSVTWQLAQGSVYGRKVRSDSGTFRVRGAKYSSVILPSIHSQPVASTANFISDSCQTLG